MKKLAAISLLIFYLIPALGFSITTHFCAGELMAVTFYTNDGGKCICGAEKINSGCCSSNTTVVEIKDTQSKDVLGEINFVKRISKLFFSLPNNMVDLTLDNTTNLSFFNPPPDIPVDVPIYVLHRTFRI